ncbi:AmmeMemoRadiSam system protein A [Sulfurimonas sp. C5]|uniref:AmmeMemoRadiSam system protein A n=1 Tax=Sulfurimonas sp. C5 TaxID=3036947 RepID=UPI002453EBCB|nr:AmmeMemoRadiSam system protein A [Sulfurimonas sp. C5]MDH4944407.1 AmmeMemoRadiSam system protein A [Sulfurimonas sp. C5]
MLDPVLLRIAKSAILEELDQSYSFDLKDVIDKYPFLEKKGACFVTLHSHKDLRGCIGSIIAHQTLLRDLIDNAYAAAFSDPRFSPLEFKELHNINLEISLLSSPELIEYSDYTDLLEKLEPNKDGLIINHNGYQGTFLPQVWEQLQTPELFLEHLAYKANLTPSVYLNHPKIYRYRVETIEEKFDAILPI